MGLINNFEAMLTAGRDNALLRFSLGNEYLKVNEPAQAIPHLRAAVSHDQHYSAAWKLLGKALATEGLLEEAREAYRNGIATAAEKGDKQAAKEMTVFLKRLERSAPS